MNGTIVSKEYFLRTYKRKSYGVKALEVCRKNGWLPMTTSKEIAYIVGYLMGDGNLSKDPMVGDFRFYGNKPNLDRIRNILSKKFKLKYYDYYLHPKRKTDTYILKYNNCIFSRILELIEVPRGDKILKPFKVPKWIKNNKKEIKAYFLKALLDSELENLRKRKKGYVGFLFQMSKVEEHKGELVHFLEEIRNLLIELDVKTSEVKVPPYRVYHRKDGNKSICANFRIHTSKQNRINLYRNISFFDECKQKALYNSLYG